MNQSNRPTSDSNRRQPESIQNRVMKSVSEYNRQLNQERKEDRRVCMDLQTYTIHYPVGLGRENKGLRRWIKRRRRGPSILHSGRRYPVALLPTQYQDWFLSYSTHELKYFPLNTVTHGPTISDRGNLPPLLDMANEINSDSDLDGSEVLSDLDDDSSCSCGEDHCTMIQKNGFPNQDDERNNENNSRLVNFDENSCPPNLYSSSNASSSTGAVLGSHLNQSIEAINGTSSNIKQELVQCKVCKHEVVQEDVLRCADCGTTSHPACLEIGGELLAAIRQYKWQCMDCKSCNQCGHPHDEAKMMFCDKCDRGYHTYCVGLTVIPFGHWVCALCAFCANCGSKKASEDSTTVQWQHELIKIHSPDGQTLVRHQVFCETCYQLRKI
ncbi:hypothetical protein RDWZM_007579 [Blomia tropicalis]|uniref:PHD-type domain-containing protein n=1 Tax=Blomia tropicalis TaxID=40697 RepID=A0A9Q0M2V4_BLOTA|nr:hypothetical protein RDWZM_007579 [Blomia tropicalis]